VNFLFSPVLTDTFGPAYVPALLVQFSEPISSTTVTTQTVQIVDDNGQPVPISVIYDGTVNQAIIQPRVAFVPGTAYTVTVSPGVTDLMGNPMAAAYQWSFRTRPATAADIQAAASLWRKRSGEPGYNPGYDLDHDGVIRIRDIMGIAARWGIS
jgi:hypothetical protein